MSVGLRTAMLALVAAVSNTTGANPQTVADRRPVHAGLVESLDSLMADDLRPLASPGAALVLIVDGAVVHAAGYGLADRETGRRVHPDSTVFGFASSTKLFTSLAAILLAEEGVLRLDTALATGDGLGVRAGRPTLRQLLTHTAGLEDATIGASAKTEEDLRSLGAYLAGHLNPPVLPAGSFSSYSNVGYALAGHAIEKAAGQSLGTLLTDRVFDPLGMVGSSLEQPLPAPLREARAIAYAGTGERAHPLPRIYFNDYPASGLFGTASDMGRLYLALLHRTPPLGESVVELLTTPAHRNHPGLPGLTLGFAEAEYGTVHTLRHGGDWQDYSNAGFVAPELATALFVAVAHPDGFATAERAWRLVIQHVAKADTATSAPIAAAGQRLEQYEGAFRRQRYSRHTVARLGVLFGQVLQADLTVDEGRLRLWGRPLEPVGEQLFRRADGLMVGLRTDTNGRATHLFFGSDPHNTYARISWVQRASVQGIVTLTAWLLIAIVFVRAVRRAWRRRASGGAPTEALGGSDTLLAAALGLAWLYLPVLGGVLAATDPWKLQYGLTGTLQALLAGGWLIPTSIPLLLVATLRRNRLRFESWVVLGLLIGYTGILMHWNLIGW